MTYTSLLGESHRSAEVTAYAIGEISDQVLDLHIADLQLAVEPVLGSSVSSLLVQVADISSHVPFAECLLLHLHPTLFQQHSHGWRALS